MRLWVLLQQSCSFPANCARSSETKLTGLLQFTGVLPTLCRISITGLVKSLMVAFRCIKGHRKDAHANHSIVWLLSFFLLFLEAQQAMTQRIAAFSMGQPHHRAFQRPHLGTCRRNISKTSLQFYNIIYNYIFFFFFLFYFYVSKVPINVYPVTWSCLDADLPDSCDLDTETQGERAFDPFVPCNFQEGSWIHVGNLQTVEAHWDRYWWMSRSTANPCACRWQHINGSLLWLWRVWVRWKIQCRDAV